MLKDLEKRMEPRSSNIGGGTMVAGAGRHARSSSCIPAELPLPFAFAGAEAPSLSRLSLLVQDESVDRFSQCPPFWTKTAKYRLPEVTPAR